MMRRFTLSAALAAAPFLYADLHAQNPPNPAVDSLFAAYDRHDSPGCALGVYHDGAMAYARGYGMANLEVGVPISSATIFDIGSTSKQFTAASLVLLEQQSRLSLDDDVRKFLPELRDYGRPITIRHLLNHTSGLRDYIGIMTMGGFHVDDVTGNDEALAAIVRQQALNFEPGAEHLYSNSGYFLASLIVERASGKSLRQFADEHIFQPLGMTHTLYRDSHTELVPQRASAYAPKRGGGYSIDISNWEQLGDGAVFTSVEDLLEWNRNFAEPRVGGRALLDALHTRGRLNSGDSLNYALGLMHGEHRGLRTVQHGGSWGGYRAELLRFPGERLSVAVLCNLASTNPSALAMSVADVFLRDQVENTLASEQSPVGADASVEVVIPVATLRSWAGKYRDPATAALRTLVFERDSLILEQPGRRFALRPVGERELAIVDGPPVRFRFEDAPTPRVRQLSTDSEQIFERYEPWRPTTGEIRGLPGNYYSAELAATYKVTLDDDVLRARPPRNEPLTLQPTVPDEFTAGRYVMQFQRDRTRRVTGFLLNAGRVRGLRFVRVTE